MNSKNCLVCQAPFTSKDPRKIYCNKVCSERAWTVKRQALGIKPVLTKLCTYCKEKFPTKYKKKLYCSTKCKNQASVERTYSGFNDIYVKRWELLWRFKPELRPVMLQIEDKIPLY